jgi:DNA-directed RNA polymerase subunit RPC12/RpoP
LESTSKIISQRYIKGANTEDIMNEILKKMESEKIDYAGDYIPVYIDISCDCGSKIAVRELDLHEPSSLKEIPVIPLFVCKKCGSKFYSISETYIKTLVKENKELFDKKELEEYSASEQQFINELQEYISRIMAIKKIKKVV